MRIDLTPSEEARLTAAARKTGLPPAEFVKRLALEHLPEVPTTAEDTVDARLSEWQKQDGIALMPNLAARTLFAQWAEEDSHMTDSEREAEERLWEDFQDLLVVRGRKNEPRISWDGVKKQLRKQGIID